MTGPAAAESDDERWMNAALNLGERGRSDWRRPIPPSARFW